MVLSVFPNAENGTVNEHQTRNIRYELLLTITVLLLYWIHMRCILFKVVELMGHEANPYTISSWDE